MTNLRPRLIELGRGAELEQLLQRLDKLSDRDVIRTMMEVAHGPYPFHVRKAAEHAADRLLVLIQPDEPSSEVDEEGPEPDEQRDADA